ncbi:helix-turn-helix domain-containing protein [Micromonospora sp. CA-111912]|uniref:helix-turn-helix domain-containing protein n=1 Tax=Micromonospora sp. CA-111912 TaxID=3239955 RepID=UPI003D8CE01A
MTETNGPTPNPDYATLLSRPTMSVTEAGLILGINRGGAYEAAKRGDIPTIRIGVRLIVPTAKLRAMLGLDEQAA